MDLEQLRHIGKEMIDYVIDYQKNIRDRRPFPDVAPGYLKCLIPDKAPDEAETWDDVMKDIDRVIMPGVTHWQSPQFHAYYPSASSAPAIAADILSDAIGCVCFSWASSPASTELEMVVVDWLAKMLDLPDCFLHSSPSQGGGVIQGSASEATLVALLSARTQRLRQILGDKFNHSPDEEIITKMVVYCSKQAHSGVEKAAMIGAVKLHALEMDEKNSLRGDTLERAIEKDRADGLIPLFLCATLGTTSICSFDNIMELGTVCEKEGLWMHIDAAYAGSAFICPEFRPLLNGVEHAMSFNFNPHKWLRVNFDCSVLWAKNSTLVSGAFNVDPVFLRHENQGVIPDFRHWQIPLGRRFLSLKLWFVLRMYGVKGLQEYIRKDVKLAHQFEDLVKSDVRFEIVGEVVLGLVCFRLKGSNDVNERLLKMINADRRIHMVPAVVNDVYFLRFAVCSAMTESRDVVFAWKVIQDLVKTCSI